ncbi:MAG: hypothetical protein ISR58_17615 [Anaerolineales bacterium]|nr:hypothetical protein [Chloroflexota bacterium]MBL6982995.1 hypothetical protein [Anaerolineales bacterium]
MVPIINSTSFGSITIDDVKYSHDVLIRLNGEVTKRKKKLSKELYGTSHKISLTEAEYVYEEGAERLLIGSGMFDRAHFSDEANAFFKEKGIEVIFAATPKAIRKWNQESGEIIGLFHITC